jgi:outer membrane protein insertion porin family
LTQQRNPSNPPLDGFFSLFHVNTPNILNARTRTPRAPAGGVLAFVFLWTSLVCASPRAWALPQAPGGETEALEITHIEFRGNASFSEGELKDVLKLKESPSSVSKFFYRTFGEKLGSKPEYFDPDAYAEDQGRLKEFYKDNGFFAATVTGTTSADSAEKRIGILFTIRENARSLVDSVEYRGLADLPEAARAGLASEPLIGKGMPYLSARASMEIMRVLNVLWNNGYPLARYDRVHSGAYQRVSTGNFTLVMTFVAGRPFTFGAVTVHVDPPREDITDNLSLRQLDFEPGSIYSREKTITSERNLNRVAVFEAVRIDNPPLSDTSGPPLVPIDIFVRPRARNEISPELIVSDEGGYFNLGVGMGFTNRNFLGDARIFNASTRIRTQDIQRWNFENIFVARKRGLKDPSVKGAVELQFQILQPYLFTRTLSGTWISTLSAEKQETYILSIVRNKIGLSKQFATYTYGFLEWTLERVSPEILLDTIEVQTVLAALREEDQPQFNSILTLTLQRDKTNEPFSPTEGLFNSISLEESGILPRLLQRTPSNLPFTQYYKTTLLGRWYKDLTGNRFNILALKLKTGYQEKYGQSRSEDVRIPLNRRFFAGGSGSVRGWNARELGAMPNELIQFGGNFVMEGSLEMRVNHFRGFGKLGFIKLDNIWGAYFLDFGNIWSDITDFKSKEIAVAAGFGIRYETFFGPFRIDYGLKMYDPKAQVGSQSVFQKKFWGETMANGVLHFGIGQAF